MLVFVYGTLTDPDRAERSLGHPPEFVGAATLAGCRRVDGEYPTLAPGGSCEGRLLRVDRPDLDRLDAYEGVDRGLYARVSVPFAPAAEAGTLGTVETYVGDPGRLDAPATWPGDGSLPARAETYIHEENVVVRRTE